jgi:hypothetical protein
MSLSEFLNSEDFKNYLTMAIKIIALGAFVACYLFS